MNQQVFDRNGLNKIEGGVLHLGAYEADEISFYEKNKAHFVVWAEANPDKWPIIESKLGIGHYLIKAAIAANEGEVELLQYSHADNNSLLECGNQMPKEVFVTGRVKVPATTVDTLIKNTPFGINYKLLTMDLQGYELQAIKGADWFLRFSGVQFIYTEVIWVEYYKNCVTEADYVKALGQYGFQLVDKDNEGGKEWGNLLFKKD